VERVDRLVRDGGDLESVMRADRGGQDDLAEFAGSLSRRG
jgi:hypothetical protein